MATIINFPAAARTRAENPDKLECPARILFFTGVRYERVDLKDLRQPVDEPDLPLAL